MASGLLIFPGAQPSRSRSGGIISAELRFYVNETTTPAVVYTDQALTIPHAWPILSDDAGRFPLIWADDADFFSCNWSTAAPDNQSTSFDDLSTTTGADVVLLDSMNATLAAATDLYEDIDAIDTAVTAAAAYAAAAAASAGGAPGTTTISTTSLTIGAGSKSLTVETARTLVPGMTVTIASTASPINAMSGQVQSYNISTGALVVLVGSTAYTGSGTFSAWTISLSALAQTIKIIRSARTADTTLVATDAQAYIDVTSGTFTQTVTASGTLGSGWYVDYGNSGTGVVTIDPAGTETIGGLSTWTVNTGEIYRIQCDGSNFNVIAIKTDPGPHLVVRDVKAAATNGGAGVATTWTERVLNTTVTNLVGASLGSNRITLPAGTWRVEAWAKFYATQITQLRLRNVTDSTTILVGPIAQITSSGDDRDAQIVDRFTLTASKVLSLEYYAQSAGDVTRAMGFGTVSGEQGIYAEVRLTRLY